MGTVTGFLDVWILDVLLKPSVSKLCVGASSFGGGSGNGFIVGEAFALPAGFAGVPFGFEDPIVWDHIAQAYGMSLSDQCRNIAGAHRWHSPYIDLRSGGSIFHLKRALLLRELGSRPEFTFLIPRLNEAVTTTSYKCGRVYYIVQDDGGQLSQCRGKTKVHH